MCQFMYVYTICVNAFINKYLNWKSAHDSINAKDLYSIMTYNYINSFYLRKNLTCLFLLIYLSSCILVHSTNYS